MCCCGQPNINGNPGYSWDGKSFGTRPVDPPPLAADDVLIFDEPGRCGWIDSHSHHFHVVKRRVVGGYVLRVQHGGGDETIRLGVVARLIIPALESLDTNARYWLLHEFYSLHRDATDNARNQANAHWREAAAEKRIKTRKVRNSNNVKVWIEPKAG